MLALYTVYNSGTAVAYCKMHKILILHIFNMECLIGLTIEHY